MRTIDRVMAILAGLFFLAAVVSAWRVTMHDARELWYLPVVLALASAAMTFGALQHRRRKTVKKEK